FTAPDGETLLIGDLTSGIGYLKRNMGIAITWSSFTEVKLYEWIVAFLTKPEATQLRATDWDASEFPGRKFVRGVKIWADTYNSVRSIDIQRDGGDVAFTLSHVQHNGEELIPYPITSPFTAELLRLVPTDPNQWRFFGAFWIFDKYAELIQLTTAWTDC